jgi:hypothetical protein
MASVRGALRFTDCATGEAMTFVDWSDPEDMFGLLIDYVTDERSESEDPRRRTFLSDLLSSLAELHERFAGLTAVQRIEALRELHRSIDQEFESDPVAQHLEDCAAELERVDDSST